MGNSHRKTRLDFAGRGGERGLPQTWRRKGNYVSSSFRADCCCGPAYLGSESPDSSKTNCHFPRCEGLFSKRSWETVTHTLPGPARDPRGRDRFRAAASLCLPANVPLHPTQVTGEPGQPLEGLCLSQCSGQVSIPPGGGPIPGPRSGKPLDYRAVRDMQQNTHLSSGHHALLPFLLTPHSESGSWH